MRTLVLVLASFALCTLVPRQAAACLNGTVMEYDETVRNVARAQRALDRLQYRKVFVLLYANHYMDVPNSLNRRIRTLKAVAHLRLGHHKTAVKMLRSLLRRNADNPLLQSRLAEAYLGRGGHYAPEALRIMKDLEKRDLVVDAGGYATLAKLMQRSGKYEARDKAIATCRRIATNRKICPSRMSIAYRY
jgi:predicted Zn-dependent protease